MLLPLTGFNGKVAVDLNSIISVWEVSQREGELRSRIVLVHDQVIDVFESVDYIVKHVNAMEQEDVDDYGADHG